MTDEELAVSMVTKPQDPVVVMDRDATHNTLEKTIIDAGLTYIGQMISHDIVTPTKNSSEHRVVTGELNLDSLYGRLFNGQPKSAPGDVELFDRRGRFKLGRKDGLDLYRIGGVAQIPEPRNDENIIVAQLHNLWLRLHNFILDNGFAKSARKARELVCLTFQLIVVEDFLPAVLCKPVYEYFFHQNGADIKKDFNGIPSYFSHASFRFGHSLVRKDYDLKINVHGKELNQLFRRNQTIENEFIIDWEYFFTLGGGQRSKKAFLIDTFITPLMGKIPQTSEPAIHIAQANLKAGRDAILPTGLQMVASLPHEFTRPAEQDELPPNTTKFVKPLTSTKGSSFAGLEINQVPLWPYILLEAQRQEEGQKLGALGSILNGQVLRTSMSLAEHSIFRPIRGVDKSKDVFHYDFERVIGKMQDFGEMLVAVEQQNERKLTMSTIVNLLNK